MDFLLHYQPFVIALFTGLASGAVGGFIILRRMALVGDALSHVALPGIALALFYGVDPFWGVVAFLLAAAVLVWWLEGRTRLPAEALVGILFTASLAVGILTIPDVEILESLFGSFPEFAPVTFAIFLATALLLVGAAIFFSRKFIYFIVAPELARIQDPKRTHDFILFILFVLAVALGIKLVGTLLMGALTIIPASIAKNVTRSMTGYLGVSIVLGGGIALAGLVIAERFNVLPGPVIILLGVGLFLVSLVVARR